MEKEKLISGCKVMLIGGSAGSLDVLLRIVPYLQTTLSFALVIVLHRRSAEDSTLEELIAVKATLPVREVEDKTPLLSGFIYIAPSDYHLLFEKNGLLALDTSEKVNYSRPSIDVAFESAVEAYGAGTVGILLSGANADGTAGLLAIKDAGGTIIVQEPESAEMPFMPENALAHTQPDYVLDVNGILALIRLVNS